MDPGFCVIRGSLHRIAFCGHLESGKSTLLGHLVFNALANGDKEAKAPGLRDLDDMKTLEEVAETMFKSSCKYAFAFDISKDERDRRLTVNGSVGSIGGGLTLIDCPGHRDFSRNAYKLMWLADTIVFVVGGEEAEFRNSINYYFGTLEDRFRWLNALGSRNIIVCLNKCDCKSFTGLLLLVFV